MKQFDGMLIVIREPVGKIFKDCPDQSWTDVLGQI